MTGDELEICQRPGESNADYAERVKWNGVRPIPFDDGTTIRNLLAVMFQCDQRDVKVR